MHYFKIILLVLFLAPFAHADSYYNGIVTLKVSWPKELSKKVIPAGTKITLEHESLPKPVAAIFLGRFLAIDDSSERDAIGVFQPDTNELHYLSPLKTKVIDQFGAAVATGRLKRFVQPKRQEGETCAGYTLYNYLHQISLNKNSPQVLRDRFSSFESRLRMIEKTNFEMYKDDDHGLLNALEDLSQENSLKLSSLHGWFQDPNDIKSKVLDFISRGWSIIIRFDVRGSMAHQEVKLWDDRGNFPQTEYNHLWLPARLEDGVPNRGAHAVVLMGAFQVGKQSYFLVNDPNFELPRIWMADYLEQASSVARLKAWVLTY